MVAIVVASMGIEVENDRDRWGDWSGIVVGMGALEPDNDQLLELGRQVWLLLSGR